MTGPLLRYQFGPVVVASDVALDELNPAQRGPAAWTVIGGRVAAGDGAPVLQRWRRPNGSVLGTLSRAADGFLIAMVRSRFLVSPGERTITVAGAAADDRALRARILVSQVLPLALSLDFVVMHASAVMVSGAVLAFAGRAGVGKSTLAAWAVRHGGATLAADDVVCLAERRGKVRAWVKALEVRLTPGAAARLGLGRATRTSRYEPPGRWRRLAALFVLERGPRGHVAALGPAALPALVSTGFWMDTGSVAGLRRQFAAIGALCTAVPVYRLTVERGMARLPTAWALVRATHGVPGHSLHRATSHANIGEGDT